ncbi:facilitated trehalose transporter Tret1-2 homolog [Oratosquilla oratoria]|uniref:facilitated trehalose transporter Tret1-2 homolog n=1 Tax=Oratosquilla oratoria TaxID=337810 RepID=UPI003F7720A8
MDTSDHLPPRPKTPPGTEKPSSRPSSPNGAISSPLLTSGGEGKLEKTEHANHTVSSKELDGVVLKMLDSQEEARRLGSSGSARCCKWRDSPIVRQVVATLIVCLSGTSVGCVFSFPAVASPHWTRPNSTVPLEAHHVSWITTAPLAVCIPLGTISGVVIEFFGVRLVAIVCCIFMACSWGIIFLSESYASVIAGRVLQGMIVSVLMPLVVVYPSEVASVKRRGFLVAMNEALISFGSLFTYTLGLFFSPSTIALTFACLLLLQVPLLALVPDSPLWLLRTGRVEAALKALAFLRGSSISAEDVEQLFDDAQGDKTSKGLRYQAASLAKWPMLKQVLKSCCVILSKELTGQYVVIAYTVRLFQLAGSSLDSYWCSFVMGVVKVTTAVLVCWLIDRFPRRHLISWGFLTAGLSMSVIGAYLFSPHLGMPQDLLTFFGWLPLACVLVFVSAYSAIAPTSWLLTTEIIPTEIRNLGCGIVSTFFSIFNFGVSLTFLTLVGHLGAGGTFFLYAVFSLAGALFVLIFIQETRGKKFCDIQRDAERGRIDPKEELDENLRLTSGEDPPGGEESKLTTDR